MTHKPKIQLFENTIFPLNFERNKTFNPYFILILTFLLPLIIFFSIAIIYNHFLFILLFVGLGFLVVYLFFLRFHFTNYQACFELRIQDMRERANLLNAEIQNEEKIIEALREKNVDYAKLKDLIEKLNFSLSLEDTSRILSQEAGRLLGDKDTTIILYLFHTRTGELGISSSHKGELQVNIKAKKGDIFDQWVIRAMQPLLVENSKKDYRFDMDKISLEDTRTKTVASLISIPLIVGNKAIGIIRMDSISENRFTTEDLRFLKTIGDVGAVAIENAQLYERLEQLAIKDSLTGLYLRRYLLERLPEEVARQLRGAKNLSFLMIDLDFLKQYNDHFGHTAGDIVLRSVGMLLDNFFNQPGNLVCRYGGEEFSVLLPDCSKTKAARLAEEIRKKIETQTIFLRRQKTHITVSIGIATFPTDAQTKDELIYKADQALYRAKQQGRNRVGVS